MKVQTFIRPYLPEDKSLLIDLLRNNTPQYFGVEEEMEFIRYLENEIESYFVIERNQQIVGCGGINLDLEKKTGIISWGMIRPDFHGQKLGGELLKYRVNYLKKNFQSDKIIVRTSQLVFPFYEKQGFKLKEIHPHFWAKNLDMYLMEIKS